MGSLMAGWRSSNPDSKSVTFQRNKSSTRGEIEAYWRSRGNTEEEHPLGASRSPASTQVSTIKESGGTLQRSNSLPLTDRKGNLLNIDPESALKKLMKTNDWWTRSNWAFLNEPPVIAAEGPSYKYASQYHITNFGSAKSNTLNGIST
ncbi:hypothetical protein IFM89_010769 [Coptis chinensis]|uniref:Uncharacterized protein n=1 Tax=Coptis chinensis TaxID=261450 RepID=A0A835IMR5_9MAGN|nr:hypothetical protein IFM89_010769 [Coptis chinensis]